MKRIEKDINYMCLDDPIVGEYTCKRCGKTFKVTKHYVLFKWKRFIFCSHNCREKYKRGV